MQPLLPTRMKREIRRIFAGAATVLMLAACTEEEIPQAPRPPIVPVDSSQVNLFADSAWALSDDKVAGFRSLTGKSPRYWGRYLCNSTPEYDMTADELDVFRRNAVTPILILQPGQDQLSGGTGPADRTAQCFKSRLDALKAGGYDFPPDVMIFLDVEPGTELSPVFLERLTKDLQYYGVLDGNARFGIYLSGASSADVRALINTEIGNGLPISMVWFAHYVDCGPLPYWEEANAAPLGTINVQTEFWQYAANCSAYGSSSAGFDLNAEKPPAAVAAK
jgi:hypothetical protein